MVQAFGLFRQFIGFVPLLFEALILLTSAATRFMGRNAFQSMHGKYLSLPD
jgi:hypothetical protein